MDWSKIYSDLMSSRQAMARVKVVGDGLERHHILPKCMGGSKDKANLVLLTYREHFIAHWLLVKMTEGKIKAKMSFALIQMCRANSQHGRSLASWRFELAKRTASQAARGENGTFFGRVMPDSAKQKLREGMLGERNHRFGKKPWNLGVMGYRTFSLHERQAISERVKRFRHSPETRSRMNKDKAGIPKSSEHRRKISESLKGRGPSRECIELAALKNRGVPHTIETCPQCGKSGGLPAMRRWHFENCRNVLRD